MNSENAAWLACVLRASWVTTTEMPMLLPMLRIKLNSAVPSLRKRGASVEKVESGSALVQQAGTMMDEIVVGIRRVSDVIGEISAANQEQRNGIGQVNAAVGDLDRMTQQNAALVEQSAAAAESLKDQAGQLARVISAFRLSSAATA